MINSAPEIVRLTPDFDEDLVQVSAPLRHLTHSFRSPLTSLVCKIASEPVLPETNAFVANIDAAFMQKVFNGAQ